MERSSRYGLCRAALCALLLILPLALAPHTGEAGSSGVTFADTEFNPDDWTVEKTFQSRPPEVTFEVVQETSGGDPGAFRRQVVHYTITQAAILSHLSKKAIYDPDRQGAIRTVEVSFDLLDLNDKSMQGQFAEELYVPLLEQNGVQFEAIVGNNIPFGGPDWKHYSFRFSEEDFENVEDEGPRHPDFSANGAPIQFGYDVSSGAFVDDPSRDRSSGIDNWTVKINGGGGGGAGSPDLAGSWRDPLIFEFKPEPPRRGKQCTLQSLTVRNSGDAKAKASKVDLHLSKDGAFDGADVKIGSQKVPALKPGASKTFTLKFNLPKGIDPAKASGLHVIAVLDAKRKVTESNENNNVAVSTPIP